MQESVPGRAEVSVSHCAGGRRGRRPICRCAFCRVHWHARRGARAPGRPCPRIAEANERQTRALTPQNADTINFNPPCGNCALGGDPYFKAAVIESRAWRTDARRRGMTGGTFRSFRVMRAKRRILRGQRSRITSCNDWIEALRFFLSEEAARRAPRAGPTARRAECHETGRNPADRKVHSRLHKNHRMAHAKGQGNRSASRIETGRQDSGRIVGSAKIRGGISQTDLVGIDAALTCRPATAQRDRIKRHVWPEQRRAGLGEVQGNGGSTLPARSRSKSIRTRDLQGKERERCSSGRADAGAIERQVRPSRQDSMFLLPYILSD